MKTLILILTISLSPLLGNAFEPQTHSVSWTLNAEKGTAIGVGKSKAQARARARQNIPDGARQSGAPKTVENGDGTYTVYMNWKK
jgi:hypothetical protein